MFKNLIIIVFLSVSSLYAQQNQDTVMHKEMQNIKNKISKQQIEIDGLTKKLNFQNYAIENQSTTIDSIKRKNKNLNSSIDSLSLLIQTNNNNIVTNSKELGIKIEETGLKANSQFSQLGVSIDKNRIYWIIATIVILLLGGLIYWLLHNRIASSRSDVENQIRNTKNSLEEESVKLDKKLVELLDTQLKLKKEEINIQPSDSSENTDHSLAIKVADEIIRIQKNLSKMDESTKGLKQLTSSVRRIQDNFGANGYELVDMLGKEYKEGMKLTANFVPSEDIESGKQIITRIIKPQVNYMGAMIQAAQIEVSVGE